METSKDVIQVGDIVYVDSSKNINFCSIKGWKPSLGTPIGIVVIPANFLPDSPEMRIISLYGVNGDGTRNKIEERKFKWNSGEKREIPSMKSYYVCGSCIDIKINKTVGPFGGYLCTDKFKTQANPYDSGYGWNTIGNGISPSPYTKDGAFNEQFINNFRFPVNGNHNPNTNINGKENTDILVGLGPEYEAANAARKYKAYDGDTIEWYLPSIGELAIYYHDFNKVNKAITKVKGVKVSDSEYYWSSTKCSLDLVLFLEPYWGTYGVNNEDYGGYFARPFACL